MHAQFPFPCTTNSNTNTKARHFMIGVRYNSKDQSTFVLLKATLLIDTVILKEGQCEIELLCVN